MIITEVQSVVKPPITKELVLKTIDWESKPLLAKRVRDGVVYEYRLVDDQRKISSPENLVSNRYKAGDKE